MNTDRKSRNRSRKAPFIAGLTLACAVAGNAGAGIPVTDVGNGAAHWTNSISTYISKVESFAEHGKEYYREVERIRNLAMQASSLIENMTAMPMDNPQKRPMSHGLRRCDPDFSGFSMADLFQLIVPSMASSVPEQQRTICKQIVSLENQLYNEEVDAQLLLKEHADKLSRHTERAQSVDTSGTGDSTLLDGQRHIAELNIKLQVSENKVRRYNSMINLLEKDMKYLAEEALNGKKKGIGESLLAAGAQTVALCGGLLAAKSDGSDFSCDVGL